jgi:hypothetical protein
MKRYVGLHKFSPTYVLSRRTCRADEADGRYPPYGVRPHPAEGATLFRPTRAGGASIGYNCTGSEMGHLFYTELGGVANQRGRVVFFLDRHFILSGHSGHFRISPRRAH